MDVLTIGEAAKESGLSAKTIRYYEEIGLVPPAGRSSAGYRRYDDHAVSSLRFVHRARELGFSVEDCRELLALWRDRARASVEVRSVALARIGEIEDKIRKLETMREALADLARRCHGDNHPDCPILDDLSRGGTA